MRQHLNRTGGGPPPPSNIRLTPQQEKIVAMCDLNIMDGIDLDEGGFGIVSVTIYTVRS